MSQIYELEVHHIELQIQNEELRLARRELDESRKEYADLYELALVGYVTVHKEGVIVRANVAKSDMLRTPENDLIDRGLSSNYINPEDHGAYFALILEVTKGEETEHRCQVRLLRTKIVPFYAQVKVEPAWMRWSCRNSLRT